jgi:hypothetical protein
MWHDLGGEEQTCRGAAPARPRVSAPRPSPIQVGVYGSGMSGGTLARSYGKVFNEVAVEYDRNRPAYPDALVNQACEVAGITDGDRVLEIGCGTGQLTRSLLARGLRVTASSREIN